MRTRRQVTTGDDFTVDVVRCTEGVSPWTPEKPAASYCLVIVRAGVFRRWVRGAETLLDPTFAYIERPGDEHRFAHPTPEPDTCTAVHVSEALLAGLVGGDPAVPADPLPVSPRVGVLHRALLAGTRGGEDGLAAAEDVVRLAAAALATRTPERVASGRPATRRARVRLVESVREQILADPVAARLSDLARHAGVAPHHLSRVFRRETGLTLSRYRARVRVHRALERIAEGERDFARLAADLGFADHAHLTRTVRDETGHPPAALREFLAVNARQ